MRCNTCRWPTRRKLHFRRRAFDRGAAGPGVEDERRARIFVLDHVIGKHLYIDYAVSIEGGRVRRVDILTYRESYGGEVRSPSWLRNSSARPAPARSRSASDIRNISGATLSSMHVTEGVKRILGRVWTHPIAFAARSRFSALSSKSAAPARRARRRNEAIDAAFAVIDKVHRLMSFHDPDSDVSRLNREACKRHVAVDPWTYQVLETAIELNRESSGVFDMTVASLLQQRGLLPRGAGDPAPAADRITAAGAVELLGDRRVRYRHPGITIDLGGIAKGFAVDRALDVLRGCGLVRGLVNAGGDLRRIRTVPSPSSCIFATPRTPAACWVGGDFECGTRQAAGPSSSAAIRRGGRLRGL